MTHRWWMFPMKPIRASLGALDNLDLRRYTLEKKYDGHRAILLVEGGEVRLLTRQKVPIRVPGLLAGHMASLRLKDGTVLDGEIWNPAKRGGWTSDGGLPSVLTFWDCVRDGGRDLSRLPIEERRSALRGAVGDGNDGVRVVEVEESPDRSRVLEVFREAADARREASSRSGFVHGVVLKLRGSPRRDHATRTQEHSDWLKVVFDGMPGWA